MDKKNIGMYNPLDQELKYFVCKIDSLKAYFMRFEVEIDQKYA